MAASSLGPRVGRRVRKTRQQLRDALVALVLERGWDAVSVLDVCERADTGRSTFYAHFADKEDLLLSGFDDLHARIGEARGTVREPFAFAEALFAHAADHRDLVRVVAGRDTEKQMLWRFRDVVRGLVDAELGSLDEPVRAITAEFIAGGFVEMLNGWLERPRGMSAAALAVAFRRMAHAAIASRG